MYTEDITLVLYVACIVLVLGLSGAYGCQGLKTKALCLEQGWPNAKISWGFTGYCIKRVDQTDIVIPTSQLK